MAGRACKRQGLRGAPDALGALVLLGMLAGGVAGAWLALRAGDGGVATPVLIVLGGLVAGTLAGEVLGVAIDARRTHRWWQPPPPRAEHAPEPEIDLEDAARLCGYDPDALRPLGWYADPTGAEALRLWDGRAWTAHAWSPRGHRPPHRRRPWRAPPSGELTARPRRRAA